jgi:probable F420-dependent oxidoreductase
MEFAVKREMSGFRFGYQATFDDPSQLIDRARDAESAGFDIFQVGDHVGRDIAPLAALAAVADAVDRIEIGTLVLNNDLRHPVVLAQELATLDHLSGGRLEVGLGAGHSFPEYAAIGVEFDPPRVRKQRLSEATEIIRALLDAESVTFEGRHYRLDAVEILRSLQLHVPILVGVNGPEALTHAARHADVIALTMLGRTKEDGQRHEVRWESRRLDRTIDLIVQAGSGRPSCPRLHALIQDVQLTSERERTAATVSARTGIPVADILETPFLLMGTVDEMVDHLLECRDRWGITYFTVRDIETFAPVLDRLRAHGGPAD